MAAAASQPARRPLARLLERAGVDGFRPVARAGDPARAAERVLFVALSNLPTLQICFLRPLQPLVERGQLAWELLSDQQVTAIGTGLRGGRRAWVRRRLDAFRPDLIVFCRYNGRYSAEILEWARARGVATLLQLDDDLLQVPPELGAAKHRFHSHPARLRSLRLLLRECGLVYCSTQVLLERLQAREGIGGRGFAGRLYCPGEALRGPPEDGPLTIGYMGIDHAHDFPVALPALVRVMERNPQVRFQLFGSIPMPPQLARFGARVSMAGRVDSYDAFLRHFASLGWAIGICPLAATDFNRAKANSKWVEYTAVGAAVVATAGMLYDDCCADGCGLLAADDAQWEEALQSLIDNKALRLATVAAAQRKLASGYSPDMLRAQLREAFSLARARAPAGRLQVATDPVSSSSHQRDLHG